MPLKHSLQLQSYNNYQHDIVCIFYNVKLCNNHVSMMKTFEFQIWSIWLVDYHLYNFTLAISGAVKRGEIGTTVTATPKLPYSTGPYWKLSSRIFRGMRFLGVTNWGCWIRCLVHLRTVGCHHSHLIPCLQAQVEQPGPKLSAQRLHSCKHCREILSPEDMLGSNNGMVISTCKADLFAGGFNNIVLF